MQAIQCFRYDQWLALTPEQLQAGDQFQQDGQTVIVTGTAQVIQGKWHVPAARPEPGPILLDLSCGPLAEAMDLAGTSLVEFPDGTALLADLEWQPGYVFSPRLPKAQLEAFCTKHRSRYQAFFDANKQAILAGETVRMAPWWLSLDSAGGPV